MNPALLADRSFAAFLFDMDGTLLNSIAAANRVWTRWALAHGLDPESVLAIMHGVRVIDTLRRLNVPESDVERESAALTRAEIQDCEGIVPIAGSTALLRSLPPDRWAIVTSAPRELAIARLAAAGVPLPRVLVTAEDVTKGKPAPDCFLLAAKLLGVAASECLVWEDTLAGARGAEAAGASVVMVSATHTERIVTSHPVIVNYEGLAVSRTASGGLRLESRL